VSDHTTTRLETTDGTVIAYLAPAVTVQPTLGADLTTTRDSEALAAPTVADTLLVTTELRAQGVLEHSRNLPGTHANDVESLIGGGIATPQDQARRIQYFMAGGEGGGPYYFYHGDEHYDVEPGGTVDWDTAFPTVQLSQFRTRGRNKELRLEYTLIMQVGWSS